MTAGWFCYSVDPEGTEGLTAILNATDGSVTSYALYPADQSVRRVHLPAEMPDIQVTYSAIEDGQELGPGGVCDIADLYTTPTEPEASTTIADLMASVQAQEEFGFDIPTGNELQPLQDVMAELSAIYGDVMIKPAQAA